MLVFVTMLVMCVSVQGAQSWNYTEEFVAADPVPGPGTNGDVWRYGFFWVATDTWVQHNGVTMHATGPAHWSDGSWNFGGASFKNTSGVRQDHPEWEPGHSWLPDECAFSTPIDGGGADDRGAMNRFIAPQDGLYEYWVEYNNRCIRGFQTEVGVNANVTTPLWDNFVVGFESGPENIATHTGQVSLLAGQSIDFWANSDYDPSEWHNGGDHTTQIRATVTLVPEPITLSLVGLGGFALLQNRRRQMKKLYS